MSRIIWKSMVLVAAMVAVGAATLSQGDAQERSRHALVQEWLDKYHDPNSQYIIFPNGQIFAARAKWTGILIGRLNLWHCFAYMPLRYHGDEKIYLRARVVQFIDDDAKEIASRCKTQCALKTYSMHRGRWLLSALEIHSDIPAPPSSLRPRS